VNCKNIEESMMRYFDSGLNDIETAQMKQHLKSCGKCREDFENLNGVFDFLKTDVSIDPPGDFEANVMHRLRSIEEAQRKKREKALFALYWLASLALAALSIVLLLSMRNMIFGSLRQMAGFSGAPAVISSVVSGFYGFLDRITDILVQAGIIFENLYYYIIVAAALVVLTIRVDYESLARNLSFGRSRGGHRS